MFLRLLLVFLACLSFNARAQTPAAPPRTVEDILAVLDQYKPDPAAVEKLRAIADSQPPAINPTETDVRARHEVAIFYHRRARASAELGRSRQRIADLDKALANVWGGAVQSEGESIGDPGAIIIELYGAELTGGNRLRAIDLAKKLTNSLDGFLLISWATLAEIYSGLGNMPDATDAIRMVDGALVYLNRSPSYSYFQYAWKGLVERSHGVLLTSQGNFGEAERQLRASVENLEINHNTFHEQQRSTKRSFSKASYLSLWANGERLLSSNLRMQGRNSEAEYYARSSVLRTLQGFGRYSIYSAAAITELGWVVLESGRFADAAALARAAIDSAEQAGVAPESATLAEARSLLGAAQVARSRWPEAIAVFDARDKGLAIDPENYAKYPGRDSNWGIALLKTGKASQAQEMLEAIYRKRLASGLTDTEYFTAQSRGFYAMALAAAGQTEKALTEFRGAVPVLLEDARRSAGAEQGGNVAKQMRLVWILEAYMKLLVGERAPPVFKNAGIDAAAEAFRLADAARGSGVQRALAESAARATPSDPALADLARREQDAQQRFVTLSDLLNRLLSAPPEQQLPKIIGDLKRDIEALRVERDKMKLELEKRFPEYAELISPKPITLAQTQAGLAPEESLISIYVGADRTYVWAVPKTGAAAFASVDLSELQIADAVMRLRRALDTGEVSLATFPRYDVGSAHTLYSKLLQPVEAGWGEAKTLIVVPHKALGQLPFALLTTAADPAVATPNATYFEEYRRVPWLIRRVAISQLPSVSTLLALRRMPAANPGRKDFAGFGDPLFSKEMALAANDAGNVTRGVKLRNLAIAKVAAAPVAVVTDAPTALRTATVANSSTLAQLARLPDTAEEIQSIAQVLKADPAGDVFLGRSASEKNVKSGLLANRRIVMFATHGLVPGDLDGLTQPALALSAPEVTGNADEDGLLTMEEILGLKLNADWVVLSACNTASGDGAGSEAVSGLGKAFFYAGARSLLVSNWPVETVSARLLTTKLFEQQAANPTLSRAEALRGTMLDLIDRGESPSTTTERGFAYAHPMFWAPFSLVGDGGR